eukprot:jgi/Psemu1/293948/fgenesh1_pm.3_\
MAVAVATRAFLLRAWICAILLLSPVSSVAGRVDVEVDVDVDTSTNTENVVALSVAIPPGFDAPFGSYPNLLNITLAERESFHPVVVFPERVLARLAIKDHRKSSGELASPAAIATRRRRRQHEHQRTRSSSSSSSSKLRLSFPKVIRAVLGAAHAIVQTLRLLLPGNPPPSRSWGIGKYDENRDGGMYESDLFDDLENTIDGFGGRRTVHLGIDLGGPVGTPVYAFADGTVHSVGYNPELGDYGHVVVVEHAWGDRDHHNHKQKRCWALYGHLDASALVVSSSSSSSLSPDGTEPLRPGDPVVRGQRLGRLGDIDENGGWISAHLHFQLSTKPPDQPHDMPGAASRADRNAALAQYPDPRYVVGPLY